MSRCPSQIQTAEGLGTTHGIDIPGKVSSGEKVILQKLAEKIAEIAERAKHIFSRIYANNKVIVEKQIQDIKDSSGGQSVQLEVTLKVLFGKAFLPITFLAIDLVDRIGRKMLMLLGTGVIEQMKEVWDRKLGK